MDLRGGSFRHRGLIFAADYRSLPSQRETALQGGLRPLQQHKPLVLTISVHRFKRNTVLIDKRGRRLCKQCVHTGDQFSGRAEIRLQGVMRFHLLLGMHVGKNVGTTEGIDRLFRITDHVEAALGIALIERRENLIL